MALAVIPRSSDAIVLCDAVVLAGERGDQCAHWDCQTTIPEMDMVSSGMHGSFVPWLRESKCFTDVEQVKLFGSVADVEVGSHLTKFNAIFSLSLFSFLDAKKKGRKITKILRQSNDSDFRIVAHSQGIRNVLEGIYGYSRSMSRDCNTVKNFKLLFVAPRTTGGYMKRAIFKILKSNKNIRLNIMIVYSIHDRLGGSGTPRNGGYFGGFECEYDGLFISPWQLQRPSITKGPRRDVRFRRQTKMIQSYIEYDREHVGGIRLSLQSHDIGIMKHDYYSHMKSFKGAHAFVRIDSIMPTEDQRDLAQR